MKPKKEKDAVTPLTPFRPKMRVSLLDQNLVKLDDRLVAMDSELSIGPKDKHQGPISLEITLRDKEDVSAFKTYLDKLVGDLPISERKVYKAKEKTVSLLGDEPLRELIRDTKLKCKTLDDLVKYYREKSFVFVTHEFLEDMGIKVNLKDIDKGKQYLIRKIKEAKDPKNDKYDPQMIVAVRFMGKKTKWAKVYLYGEFDQAIEIDWAKKSDINFKKLNLTKFPPYMIKEERERYRLEERKYKLNPELEKSKFWTRWHPAVEEFNKV